MDNDLNFLKVTLALAKKGLSHTNPNPMVGAVIVKNNRIIAKGFHKKYGFNHAETEALINCPNPKGATLYINLEPCTHFGKTPPCINTIVKSGIKRVVFCTPDPNPKVKGQSLNFLKKAGIQTTIGLLEKEARQLNEPYFTCHEKGRPFVALKFALSLDGKMATAAGDSKWITNEEARNYARKLRANYQAILIGINTVIKDDPHLGARLKGKKDPLRIIIDPNLKIPQKAKVLRDNNVFIFTGLNADISKKKILEKNNITIISLKDFNVGNILSVLKEKGIISIIVEGGGKTLGSFMDSKIVDKVYAFFAPVLIGGKNAPSITGEGFKTIKESMELKNISYKKFGDNILITGNV